MEMGILSTIVTSASWDQVVKSTGKNEMAGAVGLILVYNPYGNKDKVALIFR